MRPVFVILLCLATLTSAPPGDAAARRGALAGPIEEETTAVRTASPPASPSLAGAPAIVWPEVLPGSERLTEQGDLGLQMVAGIDAYLRRALAQAPAARRRRWQLDLSSPQAYRRRLEPWRQRLREILGLRDTRLPCQELEYVASTRQPALLAKTESFQVFSVRWPVLPGVFGEGLLLEPNSPPRAQVVVLPDADQLPEQLAGLLPGLPAERQTARRLAEVGCRVLVLTLIDRQDTWSGSPEINVWTNQPHREFLYRMSYELGRHLIGYEIQKVLAAVDWFQTQAGTSPLPIGVYGYGEGGLLALYSAALEERLQVAGVAGYFGPREQLWQEPIYRNVWGLLKDFGDGELALLVLPRTLIIEDIPGPEVAGPPPLRPARRGGAAPGQLRGRSGAALAEAEPALAATRRLHLPAGQGIAVYSGPSASAEALGHLCRALGVPPPAAQPLPWVQLPSPDLSRRSARRQQRQVQQLVAYTQGLFPLAEAERRRFWAKADPSSPQRWLASTAWYRTYFWEEVLGKLPPPDRPLRPRSRRLYQEPRWTGYEVVLDLYEGVFCYGILLVPNDLKPGERRPLVVCQHGLEGRPTDVVNPRQKTRFYNSFGAQLAERGFLVFAPQAPYLGQDRFRVLQRLANPLGLTLYAFILRQHERILDWLASLPFVDPQRIAYYGLSYGGKVAMRIAALLERYCLVICSGDFNEWLWKNITLLWPGSYLFSGEYEMFEWNLGNTFNYAEMAGLIAPRPFMVERGHLDPVGLDEWVAHEYARVRRLYAQLGLPSRTTIEFFWGGHEIHGQGTFAFLHQHLHWPPPAGSR